MRDKMRAGCSSDGSLDAVATPYGCSLRQIFRGHSGAVDGVSWSPSGQTLASGSADGTVRLWEAPSEQPVRTLEGHSSFVNGVSGSPDGRVLASASGDHTVRIWEAHSGRLLRVLEGHSRPINGVSWSPDGRALASASQDGTVWLWRCDKWEPVATLPCSLNTYLPFVAAYHPNTPTITILDKDGLGICLWEFDQAVLLGDVRPMAAVHQCTTLRRRCYWWANRA